MLYKLLSSLAILMISCFCSVAGAHELLVRPEISHAQFGAELNVAVYSTEVFIKPGRLPPGETTLKLWRPAETLELKLVKDAGRKQLNAKFTVPGAHGFFLIASNTRDKKSGRQAAYARALVNGNVNDESYRQIAGLPLEIRLLDNPASLTGGDLLRVQILHQGRPVSARLMTSYDGFSDAEHAYVQKIQSDNDGLATIRLTEPGLWMLRSKVKFPQTETSRALELSASIVFEIRSS